MYTVGKLAKLFGLSRSTLLYYDKQGLLKPSSHAKGEYRYYSREDAERLSRICSYREVGIPLRDIARILEQGDEGENSIAAVLAERVGEIDREIETLKRQRKVLATLFQEDIPLLQESPMDKETWSDLLRSAGFSEQDMERWHVDFESMNPEKHEQFLRFLGIPEQEITAIRARAKEQLA